MITNASRRAALRSLFAVLAGPLALLGQRRGGGSRGKANPGRDEAKGLLVEFHGTLRKLDKGRLELVVEGDQELTFFVDKKTTFRQGKRNLSSGAALVGSIVTIEARREFLKDLIAVNVIGAAGEDGTRP